MLINIEESQLERNLATNETVEDLFNFEFKKEDSQLAVQSMPNVENTYPSMGERPQKEKLLVVGSGPPDDLRSEQSNSDSNPVRQSLQVHKPTRRYLEN